MMSRLPRLNALRAFEAAGRHLSFTRAGEELHVTQAAISHQIKALEEDLGIRLFRRLNRALRLTEAGQSYLTAVKDGLDRIGSATERLRQDRGAGALNVSLLPTFLARWLIQRLPSWQRLHPGIELRLTTTWRLVDFAREDVDVAIRHGGGVWPGLRADHLVGQEIVPVCAPSLLAGDRPLREPADLAHHVLLHDIYEPDDWAIWLNAAGVEGTDAWRGLKFETTALALQAAAEGLGVAIGGHPFIDRDLAEGRLVKPFAIQLPAASAYYVVCPEATAERPRIKAFREWLLAEASGEGPAPADAVDGGA